ncbi:hypothetical protein ACFSR9_04700 [Deinococcus taklimakanensis]|uniref:Uncharacterized protein n=1 Tax=Deinococcus taklimakanensis TaxID=536443 RepID=A0ABW5P0T5_9DEIO
MTDKAKAIDKARKTFRHGLSTTAPGEKQKAHGVIANLCAKYKLVLHDIDPQLPKRFDAEVLRVKLGLAQAAAGTTSDKSASAAAAASASAGRHGKRQDGPKQGASAGAGGQRSKSGAGHADGQRGTGGRSKDPNVLLFQPLSLAEREKLLKGPLFSQGILHFVRGSTAYIQLLAEMHSLNRSNVGVTWSDKTLMAWLDRILARQGSMVIPLRDAATLYEDLQRYCRSQYVSETRDEAERKRQAKAREDKDRQEREQYAQAQERARRVAQERQRHQDEQRWQEQQRQAAQAASDTLREFKAKGFDVKAEAQLYLKIVRRVIKEHTLIKSVSRGAQYFVEFKGTSADVTKIDALYERASHDLQQAAERIRAEAARTRDEAVKRAEAAYAAQCAQAFEEAVKQYRA